VADAAPGEIVIKPFDQFIVKPLFGGTEVHWYTITNVTLWMALAFV
jgi:F-type H+-transporting ATPase subunit a